MTLEEIQSEIGGTLDGDGSIEITGVNGISEASFSELSFIANPKYAPVAKESKAAAIVVPEDWDSDCSAALIKVKDPDAAFARAANCPWDRWWRPPAAPPRPAPDVRIANGPASIPLRRPNAWESPPNPAAHRETQRYR